MCVLRLIRSMLMFAQRILCLRAHTLSIIMSGEFTPGELLLSMMRKHQDSVAVKTETPAAQDDPEQDTEKAAAQASKK